MPRLNVNPTRMELKRLGLRLATARRGHKLLKDKRDELVRQFLDIVWKCKTLRKTVEEKLTLSQNDFQIARADMTDDFFYTALSYPNENITVNVSYENIMSVNVSRFSFNRSGVRKQDIYPYGFSMTSYKLDDALTTLFSFLPDLLELAQTEKSAALLAHEIEKTRRRVNALEFVVIPNLKETIKYISMKLDEYQRGNLTRLMKVKDMLIDEKRKSR